MIRRLMMSGLGVVLVTTGAFVWTQRDEYSPNRQIELAMGERLISLGGEPNRDLSDVCKGVHSNGGWILWVIDLSVTNDGVPRKFFETSQEPFGMFVEYDPPDLRLGLGLGPEKWNTELPVRVVRRNEIVTLAIGVTTTETRVVTNVVDRRKAWPMEFLPLWRCDDVRYGAETKNLDSGLGCEGCMVTVRYAIGTEETSLSGLLDSVNNIQRYQIVRLTGTALTLFGVIVCILGARLTGKKRDSRSWRGR